MAGTKKPPEPWLPLPYNATVVKAMKALAADEKHRTAFDWIVNVASGRFDLPYRPGGHEAERESCFASGRVFVGQQIMKLVDMPMVIFDPTKTEKPAPRRGRPRNPTD